jgi:hypothetical protein
MGCLSSVPHSATTAGARVGQSGVYPTGTSEGRLAAGLEVADGDIPREDADGGASSRRVGGERDVMGTRAGRVGDPGHHGGQRGTGSSSPWSDFRPGRRGGLQEDTVGRGARDRAHRGAISGWVEGEVEGLLLRIRGIRGNGRVGARWAGAN